MKNKKVRNIIIICLVVAGIFAEIFIFLMYKRSSDIKPVNVYHVSALMQEDYESGLATTSGDVRCEGFQKIMISDTQKINEIYVSEGQEVKAGDTLLSYDTTLSELDVEKADLALQKLYLELGKAQNELYTIDTLVPHYEVLVEPDNSNISYKPVKTPYLMSGKGTKDDPMYWLIDDSNSFDNAFFESIMPKGKDAVYVVLLTKEHNAVNGQVENAFGLYIKISSGSFSIQPFEPVLPEEIEYADIPEESYYEEYGSDYTEAEIAKMRADKEAEIRDLETNIQVAALEVEKKQKELNDTTAKAKEDGVVHIVRDPDTAYKDGQPVIEISSGGGYYIDGLVSELDLDKVKTGDTVTVMAYNSGVNCDGTVVSVSMFPKQAPSMAYEANTNVSYYPLTVFVTDDAGLEEGEYAEISYSTADETDTTFYLPNMFIRKENGTSYVYAENAEGRLEKRPIQTGKSLWGSFSQIKDGLTGEDKIAFPYGKDVKEGAESIETDISELYNW